MLPIVTPTEMAAIDAAATEPVEVLIERAGAAVARTAAAMMGGTYGRRVNVIAGKGNNGADGRVAARRLRARGVRCRVVEPDEPVLPHADLTIDAAYGTGLSRPYTAPRVSNPGPVLAVDIPSGVDGLTGEILGQPLAADRTLTFAALKPGLLLGPGADLAGEIQIADVGLAVADCRTHLVTDGDVAARWPRRSRAAHKWHHAVWVIGGSPGMGGAPALVASAAQRSGAGIVRVSVPGCEATDAVYSTMPTESVGFAVDGRVFAAAVLADVERFGAIVAGPGLGRHAATIDELWSLITRANVPIVVDADGLRAMKGVVAPQTSPPMVMTPHDGEYAGLTGQLPGPDRFDAARRLAAASNVHVLLKGPTTIVAAPGGECLAVRSGDERLATAGTGDVLAGMIGALLAFGAPPLEAAAFAAHVHGAAATLGPNSGLLAGDLPDLIPTALDALQVDAHPSR